LKSAEIYSNFYNILVSKNSIAATAAATNTRKNVLQSQELIYFIKKYYFNKEKNY